MPVGGTLSLAALLVPAGILVGLLLGSVGGGGSLLSRRIDPSALLLAFLVVTTAVYTAGDALVALL